MHWNQAWKQAAMLGVCGGALAILFTRVASVAPLPDAPPAPQPGAAAVTALIAEVERLHQRMQAPIAPIASSRDPFVFRASRPSTSHRTIAEEPATRAGEGTARRAESPALRLVGLAADDRPSGLVRTAIISGPDGLQFVTLGDAVSAGYRVTAIRDDAVELAGAPNLPPVVLELE